MPRAPKPCGIKGCATIVPNGQRCPEHNSGWKTAPRTASSNRTSTHAWKVLRTKVLERDRYQCRLRYPGCIGTATIADHIKAILLGGTDSITNLQAACQPCHAKKSSAEGHKAPGHRPGGSLPPV